MKFDLRWPIGMMFTLFGIMLVVFGLVSDKQKYQEHSLGFNINLIWGLVLAVFGLFMLVLAWRALSKARE